MERQSPPKILQLNAVCTTLPFVLSTRQRAPRGALGGYPFYLHDKFLCLRMYYFIIPPGTGFDQSARGLIALYYVVLPAVGQVVCWHLNLLLPEAAARRATARWAGVKGRERVST